jgi:hypothetical protein
MLALLRRGVVIKGYKLISIIKLSGGRRSSRLCLKSDGTRAENRFRLSTKQASPFKSAGPSVQSTTGGRGVRFSGSNVGYTMFRGSMKRCEGDWLCIPFVSFPFTFPIVWHKSNWLQCFQGAKVRNWTPIQKNKIPYRSSPCAIKFQTQSTADTL